MIFDIFGPIFDKNEVKNIKTCKLSSKIDHFYDHFHEK